MGTEIQLAGICFSTDDWSAFDEETRRDLIAVADRDGGDFDDEPTSVFGRELSSIRAAGRA